MKMKTCAAFVVLLLLNACSNQETLTIEPAHPMIHYMGRISAIDHNTVELHWSASAIQLNFTGTKVGATLQDSRGDNYFNVIIDDEFSHILRPDTSKSSYTLAENLTDGHHKIELFKRTEWDRGSTQFFGFTVTGKNPMLEQLPDPEHKIVFYGNSITAGYASEDDSGNDSPDSTYTNAYVSYANLTARHFDAAWSFVVKSGIGIMISWFPSTMPEIYDRLNPTDPESTWNFNRFQPDLVVVNLLQNDSWLVERPEHPEFKRVFGTEAPGKLDIIEAYRNFVQNLRVKYPQAKIICMLGNMDITREGSQWPGYVQEAVSALHDPDIFTFFVPFKNTPGHPKVEEQKAMAEQLNGFIEEKLGW